MYLYVLYCVMECGIQRIDHDVKGSISSCFKQRSFLYSYSTTSVSVINACRVVIWRLSILSRTCELKIVKQKRRGWSHRKTPTTSPKLSDPPVPDPGSPDLLDQPDNLCSHAFTTSLGHADEEIAIKFDVVVVGGFVVLQLEARHERREGKVEFRIGKAVIGSVS